MSDAIRSSLIFFINTIFNLYLFILAIRLILAWVKSDTSHPAVQWVIKLTSFIIKPLSKVLVDIRSFETATFVLIFIIEMLKFLIISAFGFGMPKPFGLMILAFSDIIKLILETFFYAIFLHAIISWIQPLSPINRTLVLFNSPIMRPIQRIIPPIGNIDLSPIPALILLQLLIIIIVRPLTATGLAMAFS